MSLKTASAAALLLVSGYAIAADSGTSGKRGQEIESTGVSGDGVEQSQTRRQPPGTDATTKTAEPAEVAREHKPAPEPIRPAADNE